MGAAMAKFDLLGSTRELPGYIAVRPMTNGGFVMAKLAMALASSVLTWLITVAGICLCLGVTGTGTLFSKAGLVTPLGPLAYPTGCLPVVAAAGDLDLEKSGGRHWGGFNRPPLDRPPVHFLESRLPLWG